MRNAAASLALFALALPLALAGCASSKPESPRIRTVTHREELAACTKVGIVSETALASNVEGDLERRILAQATSLGGNTVISGNVRGRETYLEVWSCPAETVPAPDAPVR